MKRVILGLFLIYALAYAPQAKAAASNPPVYNGQSASGNVNSGAFQTPDFVGVKVFRVEVSTPTDTPILLLAGQGLFYGMQCSSGTSSGFSIAFDSATSSGITVATAGKAISPAVYSAGQTSGATNIGYLDNGRTPVQFTNGLVAITHGAAINCLYKARPNTGTNP